MTIQKQIDLRNSCWAEISVFLMVIERGQQKDGDQRKIMLFIG